SSARLSQPFQQALGTSASTTKTPRASIAHPRRSAFSSRSRTLQRHRRRRTTEITRALRPVRASPCPVDLTRGQARDRHPHPCAQAPVFPRTIRAGRRLDAVVQRVFDLVELKDELARLIRLLQALIARRDR